MSGNFIAPIHLVNVTLLETSLKVGVEAPAAPTVTEVKLNHAFDGLHTDETGDTRFATVNLSVLAEMRDERDADKVHMRGMVNLQGLLAFAASDEFDDIELENWALSNGVSMLYAHARSHFMSLAKQSPMGDFVLPPIYVQEYLKMHEENLTANSGDDGESA